MGLLLGASSELGASMDDPDSPERKALVERIKPFGTVCVKGQPCASAVATAPASQPAVAAASPGALYAMGCAACHNAGVSGAPKIGDRAAWAERLELGVGLLYERAIEGYNAMPARGVCIGCSDEQVRAAVDYMLEQSR